MRLLFFLCCALALPSLGRAGWDPTFGNGGVVPLPFHVRIPDSFEPPSAVVVTDPEERLIVATTVSSSLGGVFGLARFEPDGSPDGAFGNGGFAHPAMSYPVGSISAVRPGPDGTIVVAGTDGYDVVVARYGPDGALDPSFGSAGSVKTDVDPRRWDVPRGLVVQADGTIIIGGDSTTLPPNFTTPFWLIRYLPDGRLDPGFGTNGKLVTTFFSGAVWEPLRFLAPAENGKFFAGGMSEVPTNGDRYGVLAKYRSDGALDPMFGAAGSRAKRTFSGFWAIAKQPDGKIIVTQRGGIVRLASNGDLDSDFGDQGFARTSPAAGILATAVSYDAFAVSVRADGRIVTVGRTDTDLYQGLLAVTATTPNGVSDSGFRFPSIVSPIGGAGIQPDGKVLGIFSDSLVRFELEFCGDGIVQRAEQCDDGNRRVGDGCYSDCRIELGATCEGSPSVCTTAPTTTAPTTTTLTSPPVSSTSTTRTTTTRLGVTSTTIDSGDLAEFAEIILSVVIPKPENFQGAQRKVVARLSRLSGKVTAKLRKAAGLQGKRRAKSYRAAGRLLARVRRAARRAAKAGTLPVPFPAVDLAVGTVESRLLPLM